MGLGNPGPKYDLTRHNIGFAMVDRVAASIDSTGSFGSSGSWKSEGKSQTQRITLGGNSLLLVKAQTFMNLSGEAALSLLSFYKVSPKNLIVVVDDLYLDLGTIRFRAKGGHGGHNGLRNLIDHIGDEFMRIRIGVGPLPPMQDKADFVLRKYSSEEEKKVSEILGPSKDWIETGLRLGWEKAGSQYNRKGGEAA